MKVLVTGGSGLIGSEVVRHYAGNGHEVVGIDNNMRREFFGAQGDTEWNRNELIRECPTFTSLSLDIRDADAMRRAVGEYGPDLVVHCAAQPSHDKAADFPLLDFDVNARGTINMLEAVRLETPGSVFIHMSTNKVYGDAPNHLDLVESDLRYDFANPDYAEGIPESFSIDQNLHSVFGASKVAADVMAQEYGRYFGMNVGVFRGGCLTGPSHSGVELHGFLSYLVKCVVSGTPYTIFGYKGKQVRDQIHSVDVVRAFDSFAAAPRPGAVYNLGGGRRNSASVLESIQIIESISGRRLDVTLSETARVGDHICYYSDLGKLKRDYPKWGITRSLDDIVEEMVRAEFDKLGKQS
jgi:CDP-paratose 2-epimerase